PDYRTVPLERRKVRLTTFPTPQRITEWKAQYNEIRKELLHLFVNREVLWRMIRVLGQNRKLALHSGVVLGALQVAYASYGALTVRRMVDRKKGKISLYRLLGDIAQHPTEISRTWFVLQWRQDIRHVAE